MKLDALGRQLAVAHAHHYSAAARALLEAARQLGLDHERVIAPHRERRGQAAKDRAAVVLDRGGLAVDRLVQCDASSEGLRERLVAQTYAERRDPRLGHAARELDRDAGLLRRARPRRDDAAIVSSREQLSDGRAVVARGLDARPQLAQVLDEVVGEGVV